MGMLSDTASFLFCEQVTGMKPDPNFGITAAEHGSGELLKLI